MVKFEQLNLLDVKWALREPFDAIFCRNVMIYFDKPTQARILQRFAPLMKPHGLLFAGHSENFSFASDILRLKGQTVYELVHKAKGGDARHDTRAPRDGGHPPLLRPRVRHLGGQAAAGRILRDRQGHGADHRAGLLRVGLRARHHGRHRRHEPFHAARRRRPVLARRGRRHALRRLRDGNAAQRTLQGRRPARAAGGQGLRRRRGAGQHDAAQHRRAQCRLRAALFADGAGARGRPGPARQLPAPHQLFPGDRQGHHAQAAPAGRRRAGAERRAAARRHAVQAGAGAGCVEIFNVDLARDVANKNAWAL
jgi:hypothetical protein